MGCLRDGFNRPIKYLRLSVTDRCNFRCFYCMPPEGVPCRDHADILTFEEASLVVKAAAELGLSKVRLTGGEPLIRAGIVDFVRMLARIPGIDDLALTTNGVLLEAKARDLKDAGLRRVNVSLDTLRPDRFHRITSVDAFAKVVAGIEAAHAVGLVPIKINIVAIRGVNDDELLDFAELTMKKEWNIRFIELMPLGRTGASQNGGYISVGEMKDIISRFGDLQPVPNHRRDNGQVEHAGDNGDSCSANGNGNEAGNLLDVEGPAKYYRFPGALGTIGFISPVSEHFCFNCNRLRLTADGRLRPCLLWDKEIDLRTPLRAGATLEDVKQLLTAGAFLKPEGHRLAEHVSPQGRTMSEIGG